MIILVLEDSDYAETTESIVLPPVTSSVLTDFIEKSKSARRTAWLKEVRERTPGRLLNTPRLYPAVRDLRILAPHA